MSKAEQAVEIYKEEAAKGEDGLRQRVIKRFEADLAMGKAGASTYFQNTKKKVAGEPLKHYYKPKGETTVAPTEEKVDDSQEGRQLFSRCDATDGVVTVVDCYTSLEDAEAAREVKGGQVFEREVNVGDKIN